MATRVRNDLPGLAFFASAGLTAIIIVFLVGFIFYMAYPTFESQGLGFFTTAAWNYEESRYGWVAMAASTAIVTAVTLAIACPIGIGSAIYLSEFAPPWAEKPMRTMIELLVGIPSVVYGIFGLFVLEDIFQHVVHPFLSTTFAFTGLFTNVHPNNGEGVLLASTVLAVMVLPTIIALSQEAMRTVPNEFREGSCALGATKWETIRRIVLPTAGSGITTAVILGMMRAMGETMAVVMLIGGHHKIPASLLDSCAPITTKILTEMSYQVAFEEPRSALFALGASLFLIEIVFVAIARFAMSRRKI
jgi:phosphate transport system permease protein